jgi:hypothetical protein
MTSIASGINHFNYITGEKLLENNIMNSIAEEEKGKEEFSNGNHEETSESVLDEDLMAILADAASKSPVNSVVPEIPDGDPNAIPFPLSEGNNPDDQEDSDDKRPSQENAEKPAAKRVKKQAQPPVKRSTRARKLPTKLKPRPSSMTSSSSAMSAAAILMGVATTGGENTTPTTDATTATKKKRASKKKVSPSGVKREGKVGGTSENLRGITMKRPGKWQAQFYYSGQSRYIGIFTSQEKAAEAYEIVRKTLKSDAQLDAPTPKEAFEIARKRAYEAVGEVLPDHPPAPPPPQTNNVPSVGV